MSNLSNLKDLNLADNLVHSIEDSLAHMKELESLNLSGNPISTLEVSQNKKEKLDICSNIIVH